MSAIKKVLYDAVLSLGWTKMGPYTEDIRNYWVGDNTVEEKTSAVVAKLRFCEAHVEVRYYRGLPEVDQHVSELSYSDPEMISKLFGYLQESRKINPALSLPRHKLLYKLHWNHG